MVKKKVCKRCKMFVDGPECPTCKTSDFSTNWQGRITVVNAKESEIAKRVGLDVDAEYAIKVR